MKVFIKLLLISTLLMGLNCSKESVIEPPVESGLSYIGEFQTNGPAVNIDIYDNMAIIAEAESGIEIVNLSDPGNPALLSHLEIPGYTGDICADNEIIYTASGTDGVYIIDFSEPTNPNIIGHDDMWYSSADVINIWGDRVFVAKYDDEVLHFINVSNPENPITGAFGWPSSGGYRVLSTSTGYLYALTSTTLIKLAINLGGHPTVTMESHRYFFEGQPIDIEWGDRSGWVISSDYLWKIDADLEITDTIPIEFLNLDAKDFGIDFAVDYPYLFILDKSNGLRIFDLTESQLVDMYEIENPKSVNNWPIALSYHNGYLYIANGESGLRILKFTK